MSPITLAIEPGKEVRHNGIQYRIAKIISLTEVELVHELSLEALVVKVSDLDPPNDDKIVRPDLNHIPEKSWQTAESKLKVIKPLLNKPNRTRADVEQRAEQFQISTNTAYSWINAYEKTQLLSSLLPKTRSDKGSTKISEEIEEIIKEVIASDYLTEQKKSQQKVCDEVAKRCNHIGIPAPHDNTIRNRIKALPSERKVRSRKGRQAADNDFNPIKSHFPGADWPLSVTQIDHTKLDIILVDDQYRQPIGRPWITLSFDVFSRMVTGFYVSFDPPSALSTGICLANAILPKERTLAENGAKNEWPVWGLPSVVHVDNAKEFRGHMLKRACDEYGINIEWRPVGRPQFGAHVERALGTFAKEIHTLPGTTFSNIAEKGEYKSEHKAALTLSEFEQWLTIYIVDVYHQKIHSSIGITPFAKYNEGILGDSENRGVGLPAKVSDELRLRLDFMPFESRSVQDYGIVIDEIHYYHDVLRRWINAPDPKDSKRKMKFTVRRDPRDLSRVWFYDPEVNEYYSIPYRDTSRPAISIWELRKAKKMAKADGRRHINEHTIFEAYDRMREIESESIKRSKAAKLAQQRRKHHQNAHSATNDGDPEPSNDLNTNIVQAVQIEPFDEMDDQI